MVPDVSGIDKVFDYSVPGPLISRARSGCRVRIMLNGRRVSGWIVGDGSPDGPPSVSLREVISVSGPSVEEHLVPLTKWVAERYWGPWRSVLASASAPRVRRRAVEMRRRASTSAVGEGDTGLSELAPEGGGLLVVPPLESVIDVVSALARRGPVLVVCPTLRMARLGAAALRRRGLSTAEVPEQWELAGAGVDVVLGARSAVFAPCEGLSAVVVVDEHDEMLQEERNPTWHAREVAIERARRADLPVLLTSAIPSATAARRFTAVSLNRPTGRGWPPIHLENLDDLPVSGSLLGHRFLGAARDDERTVVGLLNSLGTARLLRCRSCAELQRCGRCGASLVDRGSGELWCQRCNVVRGSVCVVCGRIGLSPVVGGIKTLATQLRKSLGEPVIEITAETEEWDRGRVYVGTDAALHRMPRADTVVFCDVDRDLLSPHVSADRDFLARVVRAARLVGHSGEIVLQSRLRNHPLLEALGGNAVDAGLRAWLAADLEMRREMALPPFSRVARLVGAEASQVDERVLAGVDVATLDDGLLVRAANGPELDRVIGAFRSLKATSVRVQVDPERF